MYKVLALSLLISCAEEKEEFQLMFIYSVNKCGHTRPWLLLADGACNKRSSKKMILRRALSFGGGRLGGGREILYALLPNRVGFS